MSARIWRTAGGRYVGDGHLDAEILAAGIDDPRPDDFDPKTFEPGPMPADWAEEIKPPGKVEPAEAGDTEKVEPTQVAVGKANKNK